MQVILLRVTEFGDDLAGQAAAVCTHTTNWRAALEHALKGGHESVIEHVSFTFHVMGVSRALLAQLTRHRIASFSVQSQRYVDMSALPVVVPPSIQANERAFNAWDSLMEEIAGLYDLYVNELGIPKEDARFITPQATQTEIVLTMNARELKHFFSLRCCNRAQWEIRALADAMCKICTEECPVIFKDAGPGCVRGHCPEEKPCGSPRTLDFKQPQDGDGK